MSYQFLKKNGEEAVSMLFFDWSSVYCSSQKPSLVG